MYLWTEKSVVDDDAPAAPAAVVVRWLCGWSHTEQKL